MRKTTSKQSLIKFYIITLVVLTAMSYLMLLFNLKEQSKQKSTEVFNDIYYELYSHLDNNELNINEILTKHTDRINISYKVMVITPTGRLFLHSNKRGDQQDITFFTLPYWGYKKEVEKYHTVNSQDLLGWGRLPSSYEVYIQVIHQPISINWANPLYWIPILTSLFLLITGVFVALKYRTAWRHLIEYANTFPAKLNEPYKPLRNKAVNVGRDFQRLTNSLNRINQQLHQTYRTTRKLNKRLRRLTDFSPLPMLMIYRNGQVGYFNRHFEQSFMTGFQEDITYFVTDFVTGKDKNTQLTLTKLGELRVPRTFNVIGLESNIDYLLHLQPWIGEQGQVQGFIALLTDISLLTNKLKDIDIKVQRQANQLVEFDKMWSVLGHELRTPLSGIIGLLDLMDVDNFSEEQLETYRSLENASEGMLGMLNDMLEVAKMEAGKLQAVKERTDILALCHQVVDLMSSNARRQGIELLFFIDPLCPRYFDTDAGRVRQALTNLLGNAIKFTTTGYVALQVECFNETDPTLMYMASTMRHSISHSQKVGWICFRVQDTGIGISSDDMANLFSDFGQANESISRQFGGTGLGLTISNNFAKLLGGFIYVSSVAGEGSEFTLCLPSSQVSYQPVYQFNSDLSSICLIAFNSQSISTEAIKTVANYLGFACMAYTGINHEDLEKISHINFDNLKVIFLIEEELYSTQDVNLIFNLPLAKTSPKILLSMHPKSAIPADRKNQYYSLLTKPLAVSQLIKELLQLSNIDPNNNDYRHHSGSKVQMSFEAFMEQLEKEGSQPVASLNDTSYSDDTGSNTVSNSDSDTVSSNTSSTDLSHHASFSSSYEVFSQFNVMRDERLIKQEEEDASLILIAEDNLINQKVANKILEKLGYRTMVASNGQEALTLLARHDNDIRLILMDCRMPVMNGLEATRVIRANQSSIPIIALTANDTDTDREECKAAGMNGFLSKPIREQALIKILDKFMVS